MIDFKGRCPVQAAQIEAHVRRYIREETGLDDDEISVEINGNGIIHVRLQPKTPVETVTMEIIVEKEE